MEQHAQDDKQKDARELVTKLPIKLIMEQWAQFCDANPVDSMNAPRPKIYENQREMLDRVFAEAKPSQLAELMITPKHQYNYLHGYFIGCWSSDNDPMFHINDFLYSFDSIDDVVARLIDWAALLDWMREHLPADLKDRFGIN